jgi:hypothetical protein
MILMALCIIDFIGANALLGPVGGGGPSNTFAPMKSIMHGAIRIIGQ